MAGAALASPPDAEAWTGGAKPFRFSARVPFPSPEAAEIARAALAVDAELRPEAAARRLAAEGRDFVMDFAAVDARTLRAAVGTFCDLLGVAARTLEAFPPLPPGAREAVAGGGAGAPGGAAPVGAPALGAADPGAAAADTR
jgi:tRNA threonylcarbamoyladenosine modification (KEOPS) complex  Pcc1 subunit